jgi:hypothetical protein
MIEEHAEQRRRLERACAAAEDETVARHELEGEAHWLVGSLLEDMVKEEDELALLERFAEEEPVEQMTG